jgi:hypothetical protein
MLSQYWGCTVYCLVQSKWKMKNVFFTSVCAAFILVTRRFWSHRPSWTLIQLFGWQSSVRRKVNNCFSSSFFFSCNLCKQARLLLLGWHQYTKRHLIPTEVDRYVNVLIRSATRALPEMDFTSHYALYVLNQIGSSVPPFEHLHYIIGYMPCIEIHVDTFIYVVICWKVPSSPTY